MGGVEWVELRGRVAGRSLLAGQGIGTTVGLVVAAILGLADGSGVGPWVLLGGVLGFAVAIPLTAVGTTALVLAIRPGLDRWAFERRVAAVLFVELGLVGLAALPFLHPATGLGLVLTGVLLFATQRWLAAQWRGERVGDP